MNSTTDAYFEDCNEAEEVSGNEPEPRGVAASALDPGNAARLWDVSMAMVGQ